MENPFDKFIAPAYDDETLLQNDVPTIHGGVRGDLESVVNRYRIVAQRKVDAVLSSGLLVVAGTPGAGKSHLRTVFARGGGESSAARVVVAPGNFDPNQNFQEYVLHQLVSQLKQEAENAHVQGGPAAKGSLARIADRLTREAAVQALRSVSEPEWLAFHVQKQPRFWTALLGFHSAELKSGRDQLLTALTENEAVDWAKFGDQFNQSFAALQNLVVAEITRAGGVAGLASRVRGGLHAGLAKGAFTGSASALFSFFENGFGQTATPSSGSGAEFVQELLRAIIELFLWAETPIVFVFDAMETLLKDPPDPKHCDAFFRGVTDLVDQIPGVPIILLVESGHWDRVCAHRPAHTTDRFKQGIPGVAGVAAISDRTLGRITAEQLCSLVATRMRPTLAKLEKRTGRSVEPIFPFDESELQHIWHTAEADRYSLRQIVERLRERYAELIENIPEPPKDKPPVKDNGRPPVGDGHPTGGETERKKPPQPSGPDPRPEFWKTALARAKRRLSAAGADEAHAGMLIWLAALAEKRRYGPQTAVRNPETVYFSEDPSYGQLTRFQLETRGKSTSVGVGFLFGVGVGLARDLRVKLNVMAGRERLVDRLILLWPKDGNNDAELWRQLPPTSQSVWKTLAKRIPVELRLATPQVQTALVALPWFQQQARETIKDLPEAGLLAFIAEQESLPLSLIVPSEKAS